MAIRNLTLKTANQQSFWLGNVSDIHKYGSDDFYLRRDKDGKIVKHELNNTQKILLRKFADSKPSYSILQIYDE